MKTKILILFLMLFTLSCYSQKLELEKASPFTAVKWENNKPEVRFNNEWYQVVKIEHFTQEEILNFCKENYGAKWQKRFAEDLVEVLTSMNFQPNVKVNLTLQKNGKTKKYTGEFTAENRQDVWIYNSKGFSCGIKKPILKLSKQQIQEDLEELKNLLSTFSSYAQSSSYNFNNEIDELKKLANQNKENNLLAVSMRLKKITAEIADRHGRIKPQLFDSNKEPKLMLSFPFVAKRLGDKLVATKTTGSRGRFQYFMKQYPYIVSINGVSISVLANKYSLDKKAPFHARISRTGAKLAQVWHNYLVLNNKEIPNNCTVKFSDTENNTHSVKIELTKGYKQDRSLLELIQDDIGDEIKAKNYSNTVKLLTDNIAYISIPVMKSRGGSFTSKIEESLKEFSSTKALILDLRYNPGGSRTILQSIAPYIVPKSYSPWVANVAYLRTENKELTEKQQESMSGRYLYPLQHFSKHEQRAINDFNQSFISSVNFPKTKFSEPHYMLLESGETQYTKPVYILVNEHCFSAATVFTTAFKGLPNVYIVGVTPDGSSGNSRRFKLKHSQTKVKLSTMISLQRNGKPLDGYGVEPDVFIDADEQQILGNADTQLEQLIEYINKH